MAGTSTRQYNLRSGNQEALQFPVQLQLEDGKFLTELLKQQDGQVLDSESSISESDYEALIASDSELDGERPEPSSRKDKVVKESSSVTQDVINEKTKPPQKFNPNTASQCHAIIIMLALAPTPKHTKLGVSYINMCVQPAMRQASPLATLKLNVDPRTKDFQKTNELGWPQL